MKFLRVLIAVGCGLLPWAARSATCTTATTNGNWGTAGNWTCVPTPNRVPIAGDIVIVNRNFTVNTATANLASLTVTAGTLTQSNAIAVSGDLSVSGTINSTQGISIGGNTTITSTGRLNVTGTGGTHTHSGDVIINAGGVWNVTANEPISIGGNLTNDGTFTSGSNTYTFTSASAQILGGAAITFAGNLIATNSLIVNMASGTVLVTGSTTVGNGGTGNLTISSGTMDVTAATTINGDTVVSDTFEIVGTGGAKNFHGNFTVALGGNFNVTVNETATIDGLLTNNGNVSSQGSFAIGDAVNNSSFSAAVNVNGTGAGSTWTNAANSSLVIGGALLNTGTLDASANPNTVTYTSTANGQVVKLAATTSYYNLVLSGASKTIGSANGQTLAIDGDLIVNAGATYLGSSRNPAVNLKGNFTNDGTFTSGTGVFSLLGSGGQTIGGATASTFTNLTINNASAANTVAINTSPTVAGTLTFTQGKFVTGANAIVIAATGTIASPSANSYVIGNFQKNYAAGAAFNYFAAGAGFPVGDASNYTPVNMTGGTTTTAGSLTVSTVATDHPNTTNGPSPIADTKSINRYWTLTNTTLNGTFNATFTYINGVPVDRDSAANSSQFIVARSPGCTGAGTSRNCPSWSKPTVSTSPGPSNTAISVSNVTIATGDGDADFIVGEARTVFAREKEFIYTRERY